MFSFGYCFSQIRRKLPKVNRRLAGSLLEDEAAEIEKDADTKRTSKKRKGLSSDILKDDRFADMFNNPVLFNCTINVILLFFFF